jgi:hypothetical protein
MPTYTPTSTSAATLSARLIGPVFVAIGLGVLVNRAFYGAAVAEGVQSPVLIYLSGIAALVAGLAVLNAHRAWSADWRGLVTLLGWLFVIGGVLRIVLPRITIAVGTTIYSGPAALTVVGLIVLIVGAYLSFEGYRPGGQ